ncbi:MAG: hypothetical protein KJN64_09685 [Ignavibacteria bacterium]|nr:hypothetical protein [Ignavibacteria bacterium]MBT8381978.1 hypothetical protein [Ignavibacteria bacterium]MBT8393113.1 hypothetical protein [Ignavibacteria bacterium]NNJ53405.1 hypothetical protein [Ignavibacteriaceae bacterium]NNL20808.1 hypothetical protein [Ignavibacteriaceae bacterium]
MESKQTIDIQKVNEHFKITFTVFLALLSGMLMLFAVSLWLVRADEFVPNMDLDNVLQILIPLTGITMMFISRMLYRNQVAKVAENTDLLSKLSFYRTFKIISFALIEGAGFLALVGFMITANYLYVFVLVFLIGFLFMIKPSREGFVNDFNVSADESEIILRRNLSQ